MIIRQARAVDIPALVALRMQLFCEVGELASPQADPALWQATVDYFTRAMSEEGALSWLAEVDKQEGGKQIVAGQGLGNGGGLNRRGRFVALLGERRHDFAAQAQRCKRVHNDILSFSFRRPAGMFKRPSACNSSNNQPPAAWCCCRRKRVKVCHYATKPPPLRARLRIRAFHARPEIKINKMGFIWDKVSRHFKYFNLIKKAGKGRLKAFSAFCHQRNSATIVSAAATHSATPATSAMRT